MRLKIKLLRACNLLLGGLLSLVGFSMCSTAQQRPSRGDIMVKYGVPMTEYSVSGTVRNSAGKPVQNVQVSVANQPLPADTTDARGAFEVHGVHRFGGDSIQLVISDLNMPDAQPDTVAVVTKITRRRGDFISKGEAKNVKIVLKK